MAASSWGVNDALAVKLWSKKLFHEALKATEMSKFMGEGSDSMIQVLNDTKKGAGDRVRVGLRMQLSASGVQGDGTLEGNEEALSTYSDDILINQLRHAVRSGGKMSEQRIPFSVREEARMGLQDWWADRIDQSLINQLAGITTQSDTRYTGNNATIAASSTRNLWIDDSTTDASLAAADSFALSAIDKCVSSAKTLTPMIRPISGKPYDYVMFIHPYQVYSLRTSAGTSGSWGDLTRAMLQGGQSLDKNMFGNGALGIFNRTLLVENSRVPSVTASTRRAIFCGAQAGLFAVGQDNSPEKMSWVEELFDYENQLGVSAGMIFGAKKTVFNSVDFGVLTMNTYAAAP